MEVCGGLLKYFSTVAPLKACQECKGGDDLMKIKLEGDQPVIAVPVYQDVLRRDKYIEVPKIELKDTYIPRIYVQNTVHDIPLMDVNYRDKVVDIEAHKYVEKIVDIPVNLGYAPTFVPKWDVREVPRPIPRYYGKQQIIEVPVPRIQYVDKTVEKEVVVEVQDKIVPKVVEVEKPIEVIQYEWIKKDKEVPIFKYVPKFDVELDCPPPLIVPYPETKFVKEPPIYNTVPFSIQMEDGQMMYVCNNAHENMKSQLADSGKNSNETVGKFELPSHALGGSAYPIITPLPSPQVNREARQRIEESNDDIEIEESNRRQCNVDNARSKWCFWLFPCSKGSNYCLKEENEQSFDPSTGYPKNMPKDFAQFFRKGLSDVSKQLSGHARYATSDKASLASAQLSINDESKVPTNLIEAPIGCDLEPTIEYKGAINKPPEYGGALQPISFKLHAIEVHQFIPLPNVETPPFIKMLPKSASGISKDNIEKMFGPVWTGWADPNITGMPAPTMSDILQGNVQAHAPLLQQMSMIDLSDIMDGIRNNDDALKSSPSLITGIKEDLLVE